MPEDYKCELLSWQQACRLAGDAARNIAAEGYLPDVIVGITRGGWVPSMMLSDYLGVKDLLSVRVEHWGVTGVKDKKARLKYPLQADLSGKKVLLVDDLTDSGDSMLLAIEDVKKHNPSEVRTATLVHKKRSRYRPDYYGIETDKWKWIILPWNVHEDLCTLAARVGADEKTDISALRKELKKKFDLEVDEGTLKDVVTTGCGAWK